MKLLETAYPGGNSLNKFYWSNWNFNECFFSSIYSLKCFYTT